MTGDLAYTALAYHEATKLHRGQVPSSRRVDAALVPKQYKRYLGLPEVALPPPSIAAGPIDVQALSTLLHYTAGIVRRRESRGRTVEFRAASCTGALYHVEVYMVCGDLGHIAAGVYHYDVPSETLRLLRDGDYRSHLAASCADEEIARRSVTLVFTSTFWRNAWRYEARAYRHVFWDTGTMLANLLAVSAEGGYPARVLTAFVDDEVNALLGVDPVREVAVCVVPIGGSGATPATQSDGTPFPEIMPATEPLSRAEIEYPLIWRTHESAGLRDAAAVSEPRAGAPVRERSLWRVAGSEPVTRVIERRVSGRRFGTGPLTRPELEALLEAASTPAGFDVGCEELIDAYVMAHEVEGIERGVHRLMSAGDLELVRAGVQRTEAAALALDQEAAGNAAMNIYLVASMRAVEQRLGDRGYRAMQLGAGVRCGRVYLAATALGLKATALTFYDDEVAGTLGLDAGDAAVLMLMAVGPTARTRR